MAGGREVTPVRYSNGIFEQRVGIQIHTIPAQANLNRQFVDGVSAQIRRRIRLACIAGEVHFQGQWFWILDFHG
jgi:hypothetical protein